MADFTVVRQLVRITDQVVKLIMAEKYAQFHQDMNRALEAPKSSGLAPVKRKRPGPASGKLSTSYRLEIPHAAVHKLWNMGGAYKALILPGVAGETHSPAMKLRADHLLSSFTEQDSPWTDTYLRHMLRTINRALPELFQVHKRVTGANAKRLRLAEDNSALWTDLTKSEQTILARIYVFHKDLATERFGKTPLVYRGFGPKVESAPPDPANPAPSVAKSRPVTAPRNEDYSICDGVPACRRV